MIVFAVVDVEAGFDRTIWDSLVKNLKVASEDVVPLIANKILEQGDISIVFSVKHPKKLSEYLISKVRSIEGVKDIETFFLSNAVFLGSKDKVSRKVDGIQAYISIESEPKKDEKVYAIALESGFNSLAPFNRAFKEVYGVTPSEYRASPQTVAEESA